MTLAKALEEGGVNSLVTSLSSSNSIPRNLSSYTHRKTAGAFGAKREPGPSVVDLNRVVELEAASANHVTPHVVGNSPVPQKKGRRGAGKVFSRLFRKRRKYVPSGNYTPNGGVHEMKLHRVSSEKSNHVPPITDIEEELTSSNGGQEGSPPPIGVSGSVSEVCVDSPEDTTNNKHLPPDTNSDGKENNGFRSDTDVR